MNGRSEICMFALVPWLPANGAAGDCHPLHATNISRQTVHFYTSPWYCIYKKACLIFFLNVQYICYMVAKDILRTCERYRVCYDQAQSQFKEFKKQAPYDRSNELFHSTETSILVYIIVIILHTCASYFEMLYMFSRHFLWKIFYFLLFFAPFPTLLLYFL